MKEVYNLSKGQVSTLLEHYNIDRPDIVGVDTETNSKSKEEINFREDKPFLIIIGWKNKNDIYKLFTFEPTDDYKDQFINICNNVEHLIFHNAKFDLHMLMNIGWGLNMDNVGDTTVIARLVLPVDDPGAKSQVELAVMYANC